MRSQKAATGRNFQESSAQTFQQVTVGEPAEFVQHYTTEEICAWINRLCAETRQAIARIDALIERTG